MKSLLKKIKNHFSLYSERYIFLILVIISVGSACYYFQDGKQLLYGDALSRMNISRKIIDNLTPGFAQLGNVWLPLPQILMVPLTANRYLWHSGLAGAIISMTSYVIGGFFLYKNLKIITSSLVASVLSLSIYALNINLLYLQTTAMSEAIFLCFFCIALFYFTSWIQTSDNLKLMPAATAVSAMCLIRYEALAILLASIPMVFVYILIKEKKYSSAEGNTIIYATLACFGFLLWTLYLAAIFGDPFFWKNYYAGTHSAVDASNQTQVFRHQLNFFEATWKYITATIWMNGLIPSIFALLGIPVLLYKSFKDRSFYFLPVLLSTAIFLFMVLTLQRNTPIDQPALTIQALLSQHTNNFSEFNIRYGILMLPMITLLSAYLFNLKHIIVKFMLVGLFSIQIYSCIQPYHTFIYQIPVSITHTITQSTPEEKEMVKWLRKNYTGGLILISALRHDPQMLELGYDYKTYIHEGAGKYWKESMINPQKYATWIIFDAYEKEDRVTKFVSKLNVLNIYYTQVYSKDGIVIFKIKTTPLVN